MNQSGNCPASPLQCWFIKLVCSLPYLVRSAPRIRAAPMVQSRAIFVLSFMDSFRPSAAVSGAGSMFKQRYSAAVVLDGINVAFDCVDVVGDGLTELLPAVEESGGS